MNKTIPDYLYHYTNIETLALILKNKTIRFSNLCNVDDLQEQESDDLQNYGRFIFVSCWTDMKKESIPMWKIYAKNNNCSEGVRIKLPSRLFSEHIIDEQILRNKLGDEYKKNSLSEYYSVLPIDSWFRYTQSPLKYVKIDYTDDGCRLKPKVTKIISNAEIAFDLDIFGCCKNTAWDFQSEWRYILYIFPISKRYELLMHQDEFYAKLYGEEIDKFNNNLTKGIATLGNMSYVDLDINPEALSEIEITLSPLISDGAKTLVELMVEKYCLYSNDKIRPSELQGKIK